MKDSVIFGMFFNSVTLRLLGSGFKYQLVYMLEMFLLGNEQREPRYITIRCEYIRFKFYFSLTKCKSFNVSCGM